MPHMPTCTPAPEPPKLGERAATRRPARTCAYVCAPRAADLASLSKLIDEEPAVTLSTNAAKEATADGTGASKKPRLGAGAVAERTARQLEALYVRSAAMHVCATYLYRHGHLFAAPQRAAAGASEAAAAPAADGAATATAAEATLLPRIGTRYQALAAEFGPSLAAYTWGTEWANKDAPGLLHAML